MSSSSSPRPSAALLAGRHRPSLLDRLERPRAVMGLLGGAAVMGLAVAAGLFIPVDRMTGPRPSMTAAAPQAAPTVPSRDAGKASDQAGAVAARGQPARPRDVPGEATAVPSPSDPVVPRAWSPPSVPSDLAMLPRQGPVALAPVPRWNPDAPQVALHAPSPLPLTPRTHARIPLAPPASMTPRPERPTALARAPAAEVEPATVPPRPEGRIAAREPSLPAGSRDGAVPRARTPFPADEPRVRSATDGAVARASAGGPDPDPALARKLNAAASRAFWDGQDPAAALVLERRAFAANPADVEIAGNLAFYYLKQDRPDAQAARAAALHALRGRDARDRPGRLEDWVSLGVASALGGHHRDAQAAFVAAANAAQPERACRAALNAVASYGAAVRPAATALLAEMRAAGRASASPYCAWPPDWSRGRRYP